MFNVADAFLDMDKASLGLSHENQVAVASKFHDMDSADLEDEPCTDIRYISEISPLLLDDDVSCQCTAWHVNCLLTLNHNPSLLIRVLLQ